jgi:hypothetical protein
MQKAVKLFHMKSTFSEVENRIVVTRVGTGGTGRGWLGVQ